MGLYYAIIPWPETATDEERKRDRLYRGLRGGDRGRYKIEPHEFQALATDAVREAKLTTPRNNPQVVPVQIYRQDADEKGALRQLLVTTVSVTPTLARMTDEEYEAEKLRIVAAVPPEFQSKLAYMAYERGHSAGCEEIILILQALVDDLKPAIDAFAERLTSSARETWRAINNATD
jgi:hypothetical protein